MKMIRLFAALGAMMLAAAAARAEKPIQLALVPPDLQLVSEEDSIGGVRLNIYGRNKNMTGLDIGLAHETTGDFRGLAFGMMNLVHGNAGGLQLAGLYSETKATVTGLQVGMVNRAGNAKGLQIGLVNMADDMTGFQLGLFNHIKSKEILPILPIINAAF
jgi:hypothetical protein